VQAFNATPPDSLGASTIPTWKNITISRLTATGASGYSTVWGLPLADALVADLTLEDVSISGGPGVELYNAANVQFTGATSVGTLTTANALAIIGQPEDQTLNSGDTATFVVAAAGASIQNNTVPTYQWKRDGVPLIDGAQPNGSMVAGATTATLTITPVLDANAGGYSCTVANTLDGYDVAAGALVPDSLPVSATSRVATLTITGGAAPVAIGTQPADQAIMLGATGTLSVVATSDTAITYQWQKDGEALADGGRISGATTATLTIAEMQDTDAGNYSVILTNAAGPVTSAIAVVTVQTLPTIVAQPAGHTVYEDSDVSFSVTAAGTAPLSYQWKKAGAALSDGGSISGATTDTLTLTGVQLSDSGDYTVTVTNPAGEVTSSPATLAVQTLDGPPLPPVAQAATAIGNTGFTANWAETVNTTGYRLDVSAESDFSSFITGYQDLDVGNALNSVVTGLAGLTPYYYRVRAYNAAGASTASNTIEATTIGQAAAPAITSPAGTTFSLGLASSFTVTATGSPAPTFSATNLPEWVTLDATTGVLSGTAPAGIAGAQFLIMITAQNGTAPDAIQAFTLSVQGGPVAGTPAMTITTLAGQALANGSADGTGGAARFDHLAGVAVDAAGIVYVADTANNTLRRVTPDGVVTTLAGSAGLAGTTNATGASARFNAPSGVAVDAFGSIYVADTLNHTIRKVSATGSVSTFAGSAGTAGSADGAGAAATFFGPQGLAIDPVRPTILYVADTNNHAIRQVDLATAAVTTLAGLAGHPGSADGTGSAARFNAPSDIAVDRNGSIYVADTENNTIRAVSPAGVVTTVAGRPGSSGAADGIGGAARFNHPSALAVDDTYTLYVLDTDNHALRRVASAAGAVTTVAGQPGAAGSADGEGLAARFNDPVGIARAATGEFYIADTNNHTLRLGVFPGVPTIQTQPQSRSVTAGATVAFSVVATGQPAPTYQWFLNGSILPGATDSTLSLSNVQIAQAGKYTVVVANSQGSVTSNEATLSVGLPQSPSGLSSGGGGAPGLWFYLALGFLAAARWIARRRSPSTFRTPHES
jgi:sugar lactone lactonase YvrE